MPNTTKYAENPNLNSSQNNFMQYGMNAIQSPYAHSIVQKQITLQNQSKNLGGTANNSHKEI